MNNLAELKKLNKWQSSITLAEIGGYTNGTTKHQDFEDYKKIITNARAVSERDSLKEKLEQANKTNEEEKAKLAHLKREIQVQLNELQAQSQANNESQTRLTGIVSVAMNALKERETSEKEFITGLDAKLKEIKDGITDASTQEKITNFIAAVNAKLLSMSSTDAGASSSVITELANKNSELLNEISVKNAEIAQLKRDMFSVSDESKSLLKTIAESFEFDNFNVQRVQEMLSQTVDLKPLTTDFKGDTGRYLQKICKKLQIFLQFFSMYENIRTEGILSYFDKHNDKLMQFLFMNEENNSAKKVIFMNIMKDLLSVPVGTTKEQVLNLKGSDDGQCKRMQCIVTNMTQSDCLNTALFSRVNIQGNSTLSTAEKTIKNVENLSKKLLETPYNEIEKLFCTHVCLLMMLFGNCIVEKHPNFAHHFECIQNIMKERKQFPNSVCLFVNQFLEKTEISDVIKIIITNPRSDIQYPICLFNEGLYVSSCNIDMYVVKDRVKTRIGKNVISNKFDAFFKSFSESPETADFDF